MEFILAHRGNLDGIQAERENEPDYLHAALDAGFGLEVDLWRVKGRWMLGHDGPVYPVDPKDFDHPGVFFHLKSPDLPDIRHADAFAIENDPYVLTLRGRLWTNFGQAATSSAIMCAPDLVKAAQPLQAFVGQVRAALGICTDFPVQVRDILSEIEPSQ